MIVAWKAPRHLVARSTYSTAILFKLMTQMKAGTVISLVGCGKLSCFCELGENFIKLKTRHQRQRWSWRILISTEYREELVHTQGFHHPTLLIFQSQTLPTLIQPRSPWGPRGDASSIQNPKGGSAISLKGLKRVAWLLQKPLVFALCNRIYSTSDPPSPPAEYSIAGLFYMR